MKKTRIFAVLAAMAMGLAVFGCSNGDSDSSESGTPGGSASESAVFRSINFHRGTIQVECKADGTYLMTWFYGDYSTNKGKGTYTLDGTFENGTIHQHQTHSSDTLSSEWVKEEEDNDITVRDGKFTVDINSTTVTFTKVGSSSSSGSGSGSESGSSGGSTSGGGTGSESGTTGGSTSYSIAISSDSNGTVEADKTSAQKGETITLSVSAREGYELNSITVMDASSKTITLTTVTPDKKYNFTMPSSNVTVTAVFNVKYVNPHSVGDIVLKDGTFIPYSKDLTLTDEQKANAIAVIFYAGNRSDTLGARTLGVGLKTSKDDEYDKITTIEDRSIKNYYRGTLLQWAPKGTAGYNINFTQTASGDFGEGDLDGSDNWDIICKRDSNAQSTAATNYPAFNWVNTYASCYGITGMYADGWYMPTTSELITVFSSEVANKIMGVFEKIDGSLSLFKEERGTCKDEKGYDTYLIQGVYWTSCQCSDLEFVNEDISVTGYEYYDEEYYCDYRVFMHHKDEYAYVLAIHSF